MDSKLSSSEDRPLLPSRAKAEMQIPGHSWKSLGICLFNKLSKWFFKVDTPGSAGGHSERWGIPGRSEELRALGSGWGAQKWGGRLSRAHPRWGACSLIPVPCSAQTESAGSPPRVSPLPQKVPAWGSRSRRERCKEWEQEKPREAEERP